MGDIWGTYFHVYFVSGSIHARAVGLWTRTYCDRNMDHVDNVHVLEQRREYCGILGGVKHPSKPRGCRTAFVAYAGYVKRVVFDAPTDKGQL